MIYELKAGGVDERRLVGAKLEKLAEGETGMVARVLGFIDFNTSSSDGMGMIELPDGW